MFKLMIPFKLCFTMDRVLRLATSPKCRARLGYLFVLGLYFGINPTPAPPLHLRALSYTSSGHQGFNILIKLATHLCSFIVVSFEGMSVALYLYILVLFYDISLMLFKLKCYMETAELHGLEQASDMV